MKRQNIITDLLFLLVISTSYIPVVCATDFEWRFNNTHVEKRPESKAREEFANRINELTDNRLEIKIFHGDSLGVAKPDILRAMRIGAIEMSTLFPSYFGKDSQLITNVLIAGVVFDVEEEIAILPVLKDIYREIYSDWNIEVVGWQLTTPWQLSVMCSEPVDSIEKLKSKKIRVYDKSLVSIFKRVGIAAQLIPASEFYLAMQTGVVDCGVHSVALAHTLSLQEVSDYASKFTILTGLTAIGVNRDIWSQLPQEMQKAVLTAGEELMTKSIDDARRKPVAMEGKYSKSLAESGELYTINPFSETDTNTLYQAALKDWKEKALSIGGKADEYRLRVAAALEAYRESLESAD